MAVNRSLNKVRVTRLFGGADAIGLLEPQEHMKVKYGISDYWIVALQSGNYTVDLALASGGTPVRRAYPHDLMVDEGVAEDFGWPGPTVSTPFGHSGVHYADGNDDGFTYFGGDGEPHTYEL